MNQLQIIDSYRRKLAKLSPQQTSALVDKVAHVGDGEATARREYNLTAEELVEFMLDNGYERCPKCRWFVESSELIGEDSEPKPCSNC